MLISSSSSLGTVARRKRQSSDSNVSKALAEFALTALRGDSNGRHLWQTWKVEGPQKIIPLAMMRTREFARFLASI